ncbi:endonuclease/exonuclease/phosphatase family protein [Limibacter armeniacum]|uniref:endonuclease/exonuclease/phosphatase family protein n=1 Tax=Limibacter armeniacum TaxID=466084 RepID=UPI002FE67F4A
MNPIPTILTEMPNEVKDIIIKVREALENEFPVRAVEGNLVIGSWNIRALGSFTDKWAAEEGDSPIRDVTSLVVIAEILKRYDVVAIQEIKGDLKAFRHILKYLGDDWMFILTDTTLGDAGNDERLGFLFDARKIQLSGLAGEVVIPIGEGYDEMTKQFARTPYAVSFKSGKATFILLTLHVIYGVNASNRLPELKAIAKWVKNWSSRISNWGHHLLVLGDFNIDKVGDPLYEAFTGEGLTVPDDLAMIDATLFNNEKHYDQIAWYEQGWENAEQPLKYVKGGKFFFDHYVFEELNKTRLSWKISDHYPLWVELEVV